MMMTVIVVLSLFMLSGVCLCKECTNTPTQLSSHTVRYELLSSKNETWKEEMFSHYHLTPTDDSAWGGLFPRRILREGDEHSWAMLYRKMKNDAGFDLGDDAFLKEMSLHDVRIDAESMYGKAQSTNLEYLLLLDVDSMAWNFRKTAGLETPGMPYGGWEAPTCELRGHFVGHYLSASALMWASSHNDSLKEKMSRLVSALSDCQEKMGSGYLSAFPSELFDRFEAIKPVWAPYYTIHKILAGLLDQYTVAGNPRALKMVSLMVDYFYDRVQNVITKYTIERHLKSLNEEVGGMNDVLYRLYNISGNVKHLLLARLFDKPCFIGELAVKADDLSGFHANTHIPLVIGSQMRYEVTGEPLYKEIGTFFMEIVNSSHSYATGGTSVGEFWSDPKRLASTLDSENEESCTTYNMLKVSRNLFRWTKELAYADYYERALTNGVLSIQRGTEPGVMVYMLPLGPGKSKARSYHKWGTKFDSFWCCYGTGIESFSKLGDSIYFEVLEDEVPSLYIIQYISSSLNWKSGKVVLNQKVDPVVSWDPYLRVTIAFSMKEGARQTLILHLRMPIWTLPTGADAAVNGQSFTLPAPGSYYSVIGDWSSGSNLTFALPISLRTEAIKDDRPEYSSLHAILFGQYLLAGLTSGDWDIKAGSAKSPADWTTPVPEGQNSYLVSLSQESKGSTLVMSNTNQSITMEKYPEAGTDSAVYATFRIVLRNKTSLKVPLQEDFINKTVMLEPFDLPGMVIVHQGANKNIAIASPGTAEESSVFHLVSGLDGRVNTVSLESESQKGCYIYTGSNYDSGTSIKLSCASDSGDVEYKHGASFAMGKGISEYHPISFVAKGAKRNFLLQPLLSLRDESYTAYFNV